jgi:hypothetical protein
VETAEELVVVRLGGCRYALPMASVAEVGRPPALTRVPGCPRGSPASPTGAAGCWRSSTCAACWPPNGTDLDRRGRLVVLNHGGVRVGRARWRPSPGRAARPGGRRAALAHLPESTSRLLVGQVTDREGPYGVLDLDAVLALASTLPRARRAADALRLQDPTSTAERLAMDFSIRLARAAAIMTWLTLAVSVVAVTLMDQLGAPPGVVIHAWAYYGWTLFGVGATLFLTFLPTLAMKSHFVLKNITVFRALLLIADTIWATAGVAVTGGIRGPFWICFFGVVLFAAVSMPPGSPRCSASPRPGWSWPPRSRTPWTRSRSAR